MITSVSVDASSQLDRARLEDVARRDPNSPAGSGRLPDVVRRIRLQNLPLTGVDFIDAEADEIVPIRDLQANTATVDAVDADRLLISTTGTSATDVRLLIEGDRSRSPSSKEPMTVQEPEPAPDGGAPPAPATGGVLVAVNNDQLLGGFVGLVGSLALTAILTDEPKPVAAGVALGTIGVGVGVAVGSGAIGGASP